ncbi:MAG: response regulator [Candidatus Marinimicrobia bacterium]|nr:response regulator [Candidatus Neomarinimicrobiota bacterium]
MKEKASIIIVDDDVGITDTLLDILSELGYDTAVTDNGYQAIEMIKKKSYDFALMDIKMPGMNGVETFKKVQEINPKTKVIMMTAYAFNDLIKEALEIGAFDIIHKPLDIGKVVQIFEKETK